jgi:hypothetical protein
MFIVREKHALEQTPKLIEILLVPHNAFARGAHNRLPHAPYLSFEQ